MDAISEMKLARLKNRVEVLEARNANLRAEVERLSFGTVPVWTPFEEVQGGIFGDGRIVGVKGFCRTFLNSRYQVAVFHRDVVHLSIKRIDGAAVRDWRDFQRIKNELLGPECEAVEFFPAESRLVDGANQFHLWGIDGQYPLGFEERLVSEDSTDGVQQRPFDEDQKPSDLRSFTAEEMASAAGLEDR